MTNNKWPSTGKMYLAIVTLSAIVAVISYAYIDLRAAMSVLYGASLSFTLVFLTELVVRGFLQKKSVAIAGGVIVFKYAILGIVLYSALTMDFIHKLSFIAGFFCFIPSSLIWVWSQK